MKKAENKKKKGIRIPMVNRRYLLWTTLILIGEIVLMCAAYAINLLDNFIGYIVLPFWGFFTVYTAYEAAVLALESVRVTDGVVIAGKDQHGNDIHFKADQLVRIYPCDEKGNRLPEDAKVYRKIGLAFALKGGKTYVRQTSYLTQKKLNALRNALEVPADTTATSED